ncbi:MAG: MoaD/ThiS family protein [Gammaproteobacteria bacterium]|nr:MoaD/ThiS family protein [Gammaproteobacteria bacterium]MCY4200383.1 MoaD/ThiS family protein [Gammaproteobacteria bacterium]MCY4276387.1 MoaD/ThiS family protein [Gammaproteobacteria bacterium]MCY4322569.1 MoaD/ThiS family protein [Gammaproteobacteria bacterium]
MSIQVEFFASLREALGVREIHIPANEAENINTVQDVRDWVLASIKEAGTSDISSKHTRSAVNDEFVAPSYRVRSGDRVAFMPAVTGG